jgi:hypothetical protein
MENTCSFFQPKQQERPFQDDYPDESRRWKNWPTKHHILLDTKGGAYSSLVEVDDQTIGILYESSAADMIFQKIQLKDFIK